MISLKFSKRNTVGNITQHITDMREIAQQKVKKRDNYFLMQGLKNYKLRKRTNDTVNECHGK